MRHAMSLAATEPSGYGLRDDETTLRLEARAAALLGKADALFCPTATMCNQIAIHIACRPGDAIVAEATAHTITSESGAVAALSGVTILPIAGRLGRMDPSDVASALQSIGAAAPRPRLIWLENTHVRSGGTVIPVSDMAAIAAIAQRCAIPVHLDGSRLANAAAFLDTSLQGIAANADSVTMNLNKGLAAPLGSVLAGSIEFIREAVRVRQMFGGGWRPTTIPAAAGLVSLDTMVTRVAEDHRVAAQIAKGLDAIDGIAIDFEQVQTNIVLVNVTRPGLDVRTLLERLEWSGVRAASPRANVIRLVTYYEIGIAEAQRSVDAFRLALAEP